ncbi:ATP-grasp domain-containing protein (plasmid) [Streptomyces sp. NBC_01216]|uniref:ATP-grasp domain-containing protein n=1 Tax=Streptomyces sp. NBC_01216 TaxID=2903778 RepID=UPI002E0E2EEE|nr:ATP-grasp domain-containing protein [Streptomyces sp. NBC_01216]
MTNRVVVIVDPYSSGVLYAPALRRAGFSPVAVRSAPFPATQFTSTFRPDDFDRCLLGDTGLDSLVRQLAPLGVAAVVPGSESGVTLADRLTARLTPATANLPSLAHCRNHKGHMTAAVAAAGLPVTPTVCVHEPDQATDFVERGDVAGHDLVIKPATSVSTDGVTLAPASRGWRPAVRKLLGRTNATGVRNEEVVLQRRLTGTEYVVNTFTAEGRHLVSDVCRYTKVTNGDSFAVYQDVEFLPMDAPHVPDLIAYVRRALDALGFRFGAAHTEVMLTAEGPRLIEVNSRIAGSGMAAAAELATGDNAVRRLVRHLLGERDQPDGFTLRRTVKVAMFIAERSGVVTNVEAYQSILALPTCRGLHLNVSNGDRIQATSDLLSSLRLGWALLADRDPARVARDYASLRSYAKGMRIAPAAVGHERRAA